MTKHQGYLHLFLQNKGRQQTMQNKSGDRAKLQSKQIWSENRRKQSAKDNKM